MKNVNEIVQAIKRENYKRCQRLKVDEEINGIPVSYCDIKAVGTIQPVYEAEGIFLFFKENRVVLNKKTQILPKKLKEAIVEHEKIHADNLKPYYAYSSKDLFVDGHDVDNPEPSINRIFIDTLAYLKSRNEWSTVLPFIRKDIYEFLCIKDI